MNCRKNVFLSKLAIVRTAFVGVNIIEASFCEND